VISGVSEIYSGALGHGGVSTYPDIPFLEWSYIPEYPKNAERIWRNNPQTYMQACETVYDKLVEYVDVHPEVYDRKSKMRFLGHKQRIERILATVGNKKTRAEAWKKAARRFEFGFQDGMPEYNSVHWHKQWNNFKNMKTSSDILNLPVYRFMKAASYYRHYVLRELLPSHGLVVV